MPRYEVCTQWPALRDKQSKTTRKFEPLGLKMIATIATGGNIDADKFL
jgi:hypothetical protein